MARGSRDDIKCGGLCADQAIKCRLCGPIFVYFSAKTDPETELLGHAKTEAETEFKIPQPPNTNFVCFFFRFIREFTKGVEDTWTINKLNHFSPKELVLNTGIFQR